MALTITEALSELNLIKKKIEGKKKTILSNLTRPKHLVDPFLKEGGSKDYIHHEIQSIKDLMSRYLSIKGSIAKANTTNNVSINGKTMSIHDWLNWKRDLSANDLKFNEAIHISVKNQLDQQQKFPQVYKDEKEQTHLLEFESNVDYGDFIKKTEEITEFIEKLDGQLSLKNATIILDM